VVHGSTGMCWNCPAASVSRRAAQRRRGWQAAGFKARDPTFGQYLSKLILTSLVISTVRQIDVTVMHSRAIKSEWRMVVRDGRERRAWQGKANKSGRFGYLEGCGVSGIWTVIGGLCRRWRSTSSRPTGARFGCLRGEGRGRERGFGHAVRRRVGRRKTGRGGCAALRGAESAVGWPRNGSRFDQGLKDRTVVGLLRGSAPGGFTIEARPGGVGGVTGSPVAYRWHSRGSGGHLIEVEADIAQREAGEHHGRNGPTRRCARARDRIRGGHRGTRAGEDLARNSKITVGPLRPPARGPSEGSGAFEPGHRRGHFRGGRSGGPAGRRLGRGKMSWLELGPGTGGLRQVARRYCLRGGRGPRRAGTPW